MLNPDDPLIPVPVDLESYVADAMASGSSSDVVSLMADYFREVVVHMAGFDTVGTPLVPPDEHVLDHLARAWDLIDAEDAANRPTAGTVACPVESIECDMCGEEARYETRVRSKGDRVLVYACLDCTRRHGDPTLGAGASVYLMYIDEVPSAVRQVCDEIRRRQGEGSIWGQELRGGEPGQSVAEAALARAKVEELRSAISEEIVALRSDIDRMAKTFKVNDDGNFEVTRRDYESYRSLVGRAKRLKTVLATDLSDTDHQQDPPQSDAASAAAIDVSTPQPSAPPVSDTRPDSKAISARLRSLWVHTIGPLLEDNQHDLAEAWSRAVVQRRGSEVVIRGPIDFGDGDPLEGALGAKIKALFEQESCGMIKDVSYEFADREIPKLRRARTTGSDIFHPEDVAAPDMATAARALGAQLAGAGADAKPVLGRLTVAGVSKFRLWLAAPSEADRKAVGSTPGAASALMMSIARFQRAEGLYDLVVDPEAWQRYPRLILD